MEPDCQPGFQRPNTEWPRRTARLTAATEEFVAGGRSLDAAPAMPSASMRETPLTEAVRNPALDVGEAEGADAAGVELAGDVRVREDARAAFERDEKPLVSRRPADEHKAAVRGRDQIVEPPRAREEEARVPSVVQEDRASAIALEKVA